MSKRIIGTCSCCGGAVAIPDAWMSIIPPTPECIKCGAVSENSYGPIIPMKKPERKQESFRKILRNTETEQGRKFWDAAKKASEEVNTWPDYKRAGINVKS